MSVTFYVQLKGTECQVKVWTWRLLITEPVIEECVLWIGSEGRDPTETDSFRTLNTIPKGLHKNKFVSVAKWFNL